MFDYTRVALNKIIEDIKKFIFVFKLVTHIFIIAYLVYDIIRQAGVLWLDIPMLAVSTGYFVFFLIIAKKKKDKSKKKLYAILTNVFQRTKLLINLVNIAVLIYGMCVTADHVSHFAIISLALTAIGWLLSVLLEIVVTAIEKRFEFLMEAVQADINPIKSAVTKTGNFFKKITGQETIEITVPTPSKNRLLLDEMVAEYREEKQTQKVAKKQERKEKRIADKQAKKDARLARIQAKKEAKAENKRTIKKEIAVTQNEREEE